MTTAPSLGVVVPAYNAAHYLRQSLPSLLPQLATDHILVVDPGSTDATAEVARELGVPVLQLPQQAGPATARNAGVAATSWDVVLFLDSDCVPGPDVVERVRAAFARRPDMASLMGSYDASPPERNFASLYMNLRHHHVHQTGEREGAGFWGGCGAVRRTAFEAVGGFDEARYPRPMIEDVELGLRLRAEGATCLDPDLNVRHLKRWTLYSVVHTDLFCRARPWTELILATGELDDDLNLRRAQRLAAALAPFVLLMVAWLPIAVWLGWYWQVAAGAAVVATALALNWGLAVAFVRGGGLLFGVGAWLFHQLHLTYSAAMFAWVSLRRPRAPRPAPGT
ncbi:MAG: glycosyltransferase family A protein [Planctomycetota bacterium]